MRSQMLNIKNARKSIGKDSLDFAKIELLDVIYDLSEARKFKKKFLDKSAIKNLRPITGVHSGYITTKINWEDPRGNKKYLVEWDRNDEDDRLKKIREINLRVKDYLDFLESEKERVGTEEALQWRDCGLYEEWLLGVYITRPTLGESKKNTHSFRMLNNRFFYEIAKYMPKDDYFIRFNKTIYDWIILMLPRSFNNEKTKFLSDNHILYEPKLEFENWFMKNGLAINDCKNMFDKWDGKSSISLSEINRALKEEGKYSFSDESALTLSNEDILRNVNMALTKKTRELNAENRILKIPYKTRYRDLKEEIVLSHMTWDGVGRDKPVEISKLQEVVDTQCRMKNGRVNKSALGKILGCNRDTAYNLLLEDKEYSFLLGGLKSTNKSSMKRLS